MTSHILERVPLQQVRLLPGEHFDAQQAGARYLLELDVDRLLYPFRREAGLPQPTDADGNPVTSYPNWEETGLDGHIAGHYLSASDSRKSQTIRNRSSTAPPPWCGHGMNASSRLPAML